MDNLARELIHAARAERLFCAESCTGGRIGATLAGVPGASACWIGGVVTYSDEMKTALLGVDAAGLAEHGAVSRHTALAMLAEVDRRFGATLACAVTGIAGPGGGREGKPVGTVFIACRHRERFWVRRFAFPPGRERVLALATHAALLALHDLCVTGAPFGFEPVSQEEPHGR